MKTAMLLISNPSIVLRTLPALQNDISNTLYIQYFPSSKWNSNLTLKNVDCLKKPAPWPMYSSSMIGLYSNMLSYKHLDVRLLLSGIKNQSLDKVFTKKPIEVVYYDQLFNQDDVHKYVCSCVQNKTANCEVVALPNKIDNSYEGINTQIDDKLYNNVVIGGTFDRLHYGHKIMLSEAVLRCYKKITVGVTVTEMLHSKKLWELVEPCDERIKNVREFLKEVDPTLECDVVAISDLFGPTKDDPSFEMIVVSSETVRGGEKINEIRRANKLNTLDIHRVDLLPDVAKEDEVEEEKISSSNLRLRCLGTLLKPPSPNIALPQNPYILGLTGGIASGKSNIASDLEKLGAGRVDCDLLAHHVYRPGTPDHAAVVKRFGSYILDPAGTIDRKKLANIVFNNKAEMEALNQLVWPLILAETKVRVQQLLEQGHKVVVLEAAVLLRAGWTNHCHEVWVTIVPPDEAVKRVMKRNNLSEEEARTRVEMQPTNSEQVQQATIVFCSLWRREYTQKQVNKAWTGLMQRICL